MPAHERLRTIGLQRGDMLTRRLGREARDLRMAAGISQAQVAAAVGVSRQWLSGFELGKLRSVELRRLITLFAILGTKVAVNAYPIGEPIRDAGQARLLERFNARLSPIWHRSLESVMPGPGDLRAWDELLRGPVTIGIEGETRPRDLQALGRRMAGKQRDSGVDRMVLVVLGSARNRRIIHEHLALLRQTFPLDTRTVLAALAAGRDPGANGLVLL